MQTENLHHIGRFYRLTPFLCVSGTTSDMQYGPLNSNISTIQCGARRCFTIDVSAGTADAVHGDESVVSPARGPPARPRAAEQILE